MKRSHPYKHYPTLRERETRILVTSVVVGGVAAAIAGLVIFLASHGNGL